MEGRVLELLFLHSKNGKNDEIKTYLTEDIAKRNIAIHQVVGNKLQLIVKQDKYLQLFAAIPP